MLVEIHPEDERGCTITVKRAFTVRWHDRKVKVPKGYRSDGASVPRFLWRLISPCIHPATLRAAVAHDFIYECLSDSWARKDADCFFRDIAVRDGLAPLRAQLAYCGLRLYGWRSWAKTSTTNPKKGVR